MIGVILAASFMGISIVLIAWTLVKMFFRWAFAGQKGGVPKMKNPPSPPEMSFDEAMKKYKMLEYNNQLNDN